MSSKYIVAIDGPVASGKGTIAKLLGKRLGIACLSTGAIYRGVTVYFLDNGIKHEELDKICKLIEILKLEVICDPSGETVVKVDGKDVTSRLEDLVTSQNVAGYAKIPQVRARVKQIQHSIAAEQSIVCEGRDIASVVFPNAEYKFYLTASLKTRAKRRYSQEIAKGEAVTYKSVKKGIAERDSMDKHRTVSPLKRAKGAYKINSTKLRPEETTSILERIIRKSMKPEQVPADFAPPKGATGFRRLLKIAFCMPYRIFFFSSFVKSKELKDIKQYRGRPVIFACNHRTNVDVVTFFLMLPKFKLHFIGKESLFKEHSFLNWFLRSLNGIPIRRGKNDIQIIRRSLDILKGGESLAIFPEGRRNFDAESALELQSGTAIISMKSGAPVIPVVTNRAARPFKINRLRVGKVLDPKVFEDRDEFSKAIRDEMVRLLDGFEKKPRLKKRDRIPVFNARGICFVGDKLLVMKRFKKGQNYFVIPGGHMDAGESAKDAVSREIMEETSIMTVPVRPLYKRPQTTTRGSGMQVFYLCEYKSGEPKKTDAEEYTLTQDEEKEYGTFEPTLVDIKDIGNIDLRPNSVRDQLLKDIKKYGIHLTRPTIYLK